MVSDLGESRPPRSSAYAAALLHEGGQVLAVPAAAQRLGKSQQLIVPDPSLPPGDLLYAADLETLAVLDDADELGGGHERVERPGVQPGGATLEDGDPERAA